MNIYCDCINDISMLSAILSKSCILNIKSVSHSTIDILLDRKCKENLDQNCAFHQLCKLTINNVYISQISNITGVIKYITCEYKDDFFILKFYVHTYNNHKYQLECINIMINSISIYISNVDTQRIINM